MREYAVIPTYNKQDQLYALVERLSTFVHQIFVIDNASTPKIDKKRVPENCHVAYHSEKPPNISLMWNIGLELAKADAIIHDESEWNVGVLNDDVIVSPQWWFTLTAHLRSHPTAVLVYGEREPRIFRPVLQTRIGPTDPLDRIIGYAHISKGEKGLRFDTTMKWWYSDDDYDWQARRAGGALTVPNAWVEHTSPDRSTNMNPELQAQAALDRQTFIQKWGLDPW